MIRYTAFRKISMVLKYSVLSVTTQALVEKEDALSGGTHLMLNVGSNTYFGVIKIGKLL